MPEVNNVPSTSSRNGNANEARGALVTNKKTYAFHPRAEKMAISVGNHRKAAGNAAALKLVANPKGAPHNVVNVVRQHLNVAMPLAQLFGNRRELRGNQRLAEACDLVHTQLQAEKQQSIFKFCQAFGGNQAQWDQKAQQDAKALLRNIEQVQARIGDPNNPATARDIDNTLSGFMSLMSDNVQMLEADAYELYAEMDMTRQNMQFLTDFKAKLLGSSQTIDLNQDAAWKQDFDRAIALGAKLDPKKMTYDADDKKVAVDTVTGKRECMVNISQQQRMKLQNSTQKTTETYTMWSSLLKAMHNVVMTIAHNIANR